MSLAIGTGVAPGVMPTVMPVGPVAAPYAVGAYMVEQKSTPGIFEVTVSTFLSIADVAELRAVLGTTAEVVGGDDGPAVTFSV